MKNILKLEELAMFLVSAYALYLLKAEWWIYLLLLAGPDISMLGYIAGNRAGAIAYNIFHHKGIAIALTAIGYLMEDSGWQVAGVVLFGHASLDRVFGYGLKLTEGFKHTHLGMIGNKEL
jgi:hypothetical protein